MLTASKDNNTNCLPISACALRSLSAMIASVATEQSIDSLTICDMLAARFDVKEVTAIPDTCFQDALDFLVDFKISKIVN